VRSSDDSGDGDVDARGDGEEEEEQSPVHLRFYTLQGA
jgi:hypothetical protein